MKIDNYLPNYYTGVSGSSRFGTVYATFAQLRKVLGAPHRAFDTRADVGRGDGKVSTEWYFRTADGVSIVTIYDFKATSLYDRHLPTPEQFRRQRRPFDWSVGAHTTAAADAFVRVLHAALEVK